jgi:surfactin synthase thioesterase subunit
MTKTPEIRQELAEERRELKEAVAELRGELDEKAKRGKKLLGIATGAAVAAKVLLRLKRRRS